MTDERSAVTAAELDELQKRLRELHRFAAEQKSRDWDEQDEIRDLFAYVFDTAYRAADALAALRRERDNWKDRYDELKVDALDLHADNTKKDAALRELDLWFARADLPHLSEETRNTLAALGIHPETADAGANWCTCLKRQVRACSCAGWNREATYTPAPAPAISGGEMVSPDRDVEWLWGEIQRLRAALAAAGQKP